MSTMTHRPVSVVALRSRMGEQQTRLLDVRTPAEFETSHIPGSFNIPLDTLRSQSSYVGEHLDGDVVLICQSGQRAESAADELARVGLTRTGVLEGGMGAWEAADGPIERGRRTWALERQVRLVAGSIVLAGVLGSTRFPRMKWVSAGIGGGLTFAALSNTCAMGAVLMKMPWNNPAPVDVEATLGSLTR